MLNRFINKSLLIQHSKQLRYYSSRTESSSTTGNEPDPQLGGYPQFIPLSAQEKNPYGTYWDKQGRFNFGETVSLCLQLSLSTYLSMNKNIIAS